MPRAANNSAAQAVSASAASSRIRFRVRRDVKGEKVLRDEHQARVNRPCEAGKATKTNAPFAPVAAATTATLTGLPQEVTSANGAFRFTLSNECRKQRRYGRSCSIS